ncbi:MAG: translesion DNA synthesis-associated protein ImuA, partial [Pseudomonadota bacterium]
YGYTVRMKTLTLPAAKSPAAKSPAAKSPADRSPAGKTLAGKHPSGNSPASKPAALTPLLTHPDLWQAGQLKPVTGVCATGYDELDDALNGGWPSAGITELLHDAPGIGELQLLLPAMRELSQAQKRWLVWINPPYQPCAPALQAAGVDISKILLVHPRNAEQALWALEQSLKSGSSAMVLCWFGQHSGQQVSGQKTLREDALTPAQSRRLQLAAKQGNSFGCLFRSATAHRQPSMASLRLQLDSAPAANASVAAAAESAKTADHSRCGQHGELTVHVRKQRGGWPVQDLTLALDYTPARQQRQQRTVQEQLMLWRHGRPARQQPMAAGQRQPAEVTQNGRQADARPVSEPRVLH